MLVDRKSDQTAFLLFSRIAVGKIGRDIFVSEISESSWAFALHILVR